MICRNRWMPRATGLPAAAGVGRSGVGCVGRLRTRRGSVPRCCCCRLRPGPRRPSSGRARRGGVPRARSRRSRRGTSPRCGRRAPTTSSSSVETTITGMPGVARRDDALVDELDRADVEPAGRLGGDEAAAGRGSARGRARPSAGCRRRAVPTVRVDALGAHVELARASPSANSSRSPSCSVPALTNGAPSERSSIRFSAMRELADQAVLVAVLRHEPDAGVEHLPRRC